MIVRRERLAQPDVTLVHPVFHCPTPLRFVNDEIGPWWRYRKELVKRCTDWREDSARLDLDSALAEEVPRLFPPPASSDLLAASSSWQPVDGEVENVVVTLGGVYGGADGPAGLFEYASSVVISVSWLLLDTGHAVEVSVPVLRAALQWLLATYPKAFGNIILCAFSMGSATACHVAAEFGRAVRALVVVSGQSSGTDGIVAFAGKPVLLVVGEADTAVTPAASQDIAEKALSAGAHVDFRVFPQEPYRLQELSEEEKMLVQFRNHHLWDERWEVQELILGWIRQRFNER